MRRREPPRGDLGDALEIVLSGCVVLCAMLSLDDLAHLRVDMVLLMVGVVAVSTLTYVRLMRSQA